MKLRDFLKEDINFGIETKFIIGRFILVGSYSGKTRYDSEINSEKILNRYLDCKVEGLRSGIEVDRFDDCFAQSAILIYLSGDDVFKEEEKARSAKYKKM